MKKLLIVCSLFLSFQSIGQGKLSKADIVKFDFNSLAQTKKKIRAKDGSVVKAYEILMLDCKKMLKYGAHSVMDKKDIPPSGNKHDYMSIAPYWWPDSSKPGGVPYIRKDGLVNPEVNNYLDKENMPKLCEVVYGLSLGYYFSEDEQYAQKISKLLQVWFLDSATKMNPNVNYGQAVKGVIEGRAEGLIDTRHFIFLLDAVKLISKSKYWTKANSTGLKNWFTEYYQWMNASKIGLDELNAENNHGVWFDAQALSIANYLGNTDESRKIIKRALGRLNIEMDKSGSFPKELERATTLHYSVFILNAFEIIAQLAQEANMEFRNVSTPDGRTLKSAYDFLIPYLLEEKEWKWKQVKHFDTDNAYPLLIAAKRKYNCDSCLGFVKSKNQNFEQTILRLLL
jgi:hypothetical protein